MKNLFNTATQPILLKHHLETKHFDKMNRDHSYFQQLGKNVKRQRMDKTVKIQQKGAKTVKASYEGLALESFCDCIVSCYVSCKNLGQKSDWRASRGKLNNVSFFGNTVKRCNKKMS